ncbi:hypothetical protein AD006_28770 (plasmid) [Pseudonocardia sp. EC080610-09]|nr:hypothetical protein AD006_28770 [Pseudonocardia sp. EC080610-09]ALL85722.1 hypothetical protein AD017_29160 [Pseudonocardia sp. EC080619-01]
MLDAPSGRLAVDEIRLGGAPRGAVVVLDAPDELGGTAAVLNELAGHGYTSVGARLPPGAEDSELRDDAHRLLDVLERRGFAADGCAVLGYGAGARAALHLATDRIGAAVSISPDTGPDLAHLDRLRTPWLGLFGLPPSGLDPVADRLEQTVTASAQAHCSVVRYPGVGPDFHLDSADPAVHAACFDAWQRAVEWLNLRVAPPPTELALLWERRRSGTDPEHAAPGSTTTTARKG